MFPTRRLAATVTATATALLLAACGGGSQADSSSSEQDSAAAASDASFPRTIEHAMGSTEIPAQPQRVVALDASFVDATLILDTPVVGFTSYRAIGDELPAYLGEDAEEYGADAEPVGTLAEPSLEKIAALKPDLIVSAKVRHEALYEQLSAIAPTIFTETTGPTWKQNITWLGEALGQEELAAQELAAYEERAAAVGAEIKATAGDPTISVVRFLDGPTRLYQKKSFSGFVLADAGLRRPPSQDVDDFAAEISEELIPQADADHIFVTVSDDENGTGSAALAKYEANPLWGQLTGQVHDVSDELWMTAVGLQGAHAILDDLAATFEVDPHSTS